MTGPFTLELQRNGAYAKLADAAGNHWLSLALTTAFDTAAAPDETLSLGAHADGDRIDVERRSTVWDRAGLTIERDCDRFEVRAWVEGTGDLTEVHLLGGRMLVPTGNTGFVSTGTSATTLFSPNPGDPAKLVRSAAEAAVIGVNGDGALGRGHWFFTPAPLQLALAREPGGDWITLALSAPVGELDFVQAAYRPGDRAFHLVLDYEGHRRVDGRFEAPLLVLETNVRDPYDGLRRHRAEVSRRGHAPAVTRRERPAWWSEPIFCGWGAQCHLAGVEHGHAPDYSTQERYDAFLGALERNGVVPGTLVLDDKWQETYGENRPDEAKWPDLRGWIADRHARRQRVLLWWKAWDAEGLDEALTVRTSEGAATVLDPTNERARDTVRETVAAMLAPDGLDADGLKIDFTARTPSGRALRAAGEGWGIRLLHDLLAVVYDHSKRVKPDALIVTHTPNPAFVDVTDMIRLNDALRLDDPGPLPDVVPQMRYRADVARAACPDLMVETDDWCMPDRETWRRFLEVKPELGVPSLYYATHIDWSGEALLEDDYAAIRRVWDEWRARRDDAYWARA